MSDATVAKKPRETDDVPVPPTLRKSLKNRHIQLIALGGAIGTGLFYGSSESIQLAGPAILLAYLIGGLAIFLIVRALSEMAVEDPKAGAFSYYATQYWSKRAGFISGWNYWFNYVLVAMVELAVVGSFVNYWFPNIPKWVSAAVFLVAIAALNLMGVNKFGEFEFWFAIIKIVAVLAMIFGGLYVIIANVPTASGIRASFANWFTVDGDSCRMADVSQCGRHVDRPADGAGRGDVQLRRYRAHRHHRGRNRNPRTTIEGHERHYLAYSRVLHLRARRDYGRGAVEHDRRQFQPVRADFRLGGRACGRRHSEFRVLDRRDERVQLRPVRELAHAVFVGEAGQCARVSGPPEQARRSGRGCDHVGHHHCDRRGGGVRVA